jgi:hypothetical protein
MWPVSISMWPVSMSTRHSSDGEGQAPKDHGQEKRDVIVAEKDVLDAGANETSDELQRRAISGAVLSRTNSRSPCSVAITATWRAAGVTQVAAAGRTGPGDRDQNVGVGWPGRCRRPRAFARLGTKDTRRSPRANGTRKCDIRVLAYSVAPLPFPMLDIAFTDDGASGGRAADQTHDAACRADTNGGGRPSIRVDNQPNP